MTQNCKSIQPNKPALIALQMMEEYSLNSLPVVDIDNQVIGAINMHTLMQAKVAIEFVSPKTVLFFVVLLICHIIHT